MKYLASMIILLFLIISNENIQAQWVQTNGPSGGDVKCFAVSGTNLFAGIGDRVYLSTNNGTNWTATYNGLNDSQVISLAFSRTNLFAGTFGGGAFLSTNNGTSWDAINNGLTDPDVITFAVSGTIIFAGTASGVFLSTNNGTSWTAANNGLKSPIYALAVSGTNLFAGTYYGLFLSTNNGSSWVNTHGSWDFLYGVNALAVSGSNLFAGTIFGVFTSTDIGTSWTLVNNGLNSSITTFAVYGTNLFAGTNGGGVYLSTNNGTSWTAVNNGFTSYPNVQALAVSGTNLFAGTNSAGVWTRPLTDFPTGVSNEVTALPQYFALFQNYPNPFNPNTIITYSLPSASNVKLIIYNSLGQTIIILENGYKNAGNYSVNFNASDLSSGIYFCKLKAGQFSQVKKMILNK